MRTLISAAVLVSLASLCLGGPVGLVFHSDFNGDYETEIGPSPTDVSGTPEYVTVHDGEGILLEGDAYLRYRADGAFAKSAGTVAFWVQPQWSGDDGKRYGLFSDSAPTHSPAYNAMYLMKTPSSTLQFNIRDATDHVLQTSIKGWRAGQWHHVAVTWDRNRGAAMYVDGMLAAEKDFSFEPRQWPYFNVGSDYDGSVTARSAFSNVRIYDRMLRPDQVVAIADGKPLETAGLIEMAAPAKIKTATTFELSLTALAAEPISLEHNVLVRVGDTPIASVSPEPAAATWQPGKPIQLQPMTIRVPEYLAAGGGETELSAVLEGAITSSTVPRAVAEVKVETPRRGPKISQFELKNGVVYEQGKPWVPKAPDAGFLYNNEFFPGGEEGQKMARRLYEDGALQDALRCRIVDRVESVSTGDPEEGWSMRSAAGNLVAGPSANMLVVELTRDPGETLGVQVQAAGNQTLTDHMLLWGSIAPGMWRSLDYRTAFVFYPKTDACTVKLSYLNSGEPAHRNVKRMTVYELLDYPLDNHVQMPDDWRQRKVWLFPTHSRQIYNTFGHDERTPMERDYSVRAAMHYARFLGVDGLNLYAAGPEGPYYDDGIVPNIWRWDLLKDIPPLASKASLDIVPIVPSLSCFDDLYTFNEDSFQVDSAGEVVRTDSGHKCPDPLRPEVEQQLLAFLDEITTATAGDKNIPAIGMSVHGARGTCYCSTGENVTAARAGYSPFNLLGFQAQARTVVRPGTQDPAAAYEWLREDEARWRRWIDFRCAETHDLWTKCRDMVVSRSAERKLFVDTCIPVPAESGEFSTRQLLRNHGYDPALFRAEKGIQIAGETQPNLPAGTVSSFRTGEGLHVQFDCTNLPGGREFFKPILQVIMETNPASISFRNPLDAKAGREMMLRPFIRAFRALARENPRELKGEVWPQSKDIWVRLYGDAIAVINPTADAQEVRITFEEQFPMNTAIVDMGTGRNVRMLRGRKISRVVVQTQPYELRTLYIKKPLVEPGVRYESGMRPSPLETE
ncbi:MAG: LamG domain-containing protein [Armatimonadota bacterium]